MLLDSMVDFVPFSSFAVSSAACAGDAPLAAGEEERVATAVHVCRDLAHESATVGEGSVENILDLVIFHEDKRGDADKEGEERCHCNKLHEAAAAA